MSRTTNPLLTIGTDREIFEIPYSSLLFFRNAAIQLRWNEFKGLSWQLRALSDVLTNAVRADQVVLVRMKKRFSCDSDGENDEADGAASESVLLRDPEVPRAWASIIETVPEGPDFGASPIGRRFLVFWPQAKAFNAHLLRKEQVQKHHMAFEEIDFVPPSVDYLSRHQQVGISPLDIPGARRLESLEHLTREERLFAVMMHSGSIHAPHSQRPHTAQWTTHEKRRTHRIFAKQLAVEVAVSNDVSPLVVQKVAELKRGRDAAFSGLGLDQKPYPRKMLKTSAGNDNEFVDQVLMENSRSNNRQGHSVELGNDVLTNIFAMALVDDIRSCSEFKQTFLALRATNKLGQSVAEGVLGINLVGANTKLAQALNGTAHPREAAAVAEKLGLFVDDVLWLNRPENLVNTPPLRLPRCPQMAPDFKKYLQIRKSNDRRYQPRIATKPATPPSSVFSVIIRNLERVRGIDMDVSEDVSKNFDALPIVKSNSFDGMLAAAGIE